MHRTPPVRGKGGAHLSRSSCGSSHRPFFSPWCGHGRTLRRRSYIVHAEPAHPVSCTRQSRTAAQARQGSDPGSARRGRRRTRPHPRGAIGRRRGLAAARARRRPARRRPGGRFPSWPRLVADFQERDVKAFREAVRRKDIPRTQQLVALDHVRAHIISDVRLRPARRACRGEERVAARRADWRGRRREPAQRLAERPLHGARQCRRGDGAMAPRTGRGADAERRGATRLARGSAAPRGRRSRARPRPRRRRSAAAP